MKRNTIWMYVLAAIVVVVGIGGLMMSSMANRDTLRYDGYDNSLREYNDNEYFNRNNADEDLSDYSDEELQDYYRDYYERNSANRGYYGMMSGNYGDCHNYNSYD